MQNVDDENKSKTEISDTSRTVFALVKETSYQDGVKNSVLNYSYDNQGRLTNIEQDVDGQERWNEEKEVYEYILTSDGIINRSIFFEYDENGNVVKKSYTYPQQNESSDDFYEYKYEFDEDGNAIRCTEYYKGELSFREYVCEFTWQDGHLIQEKLSGAEDYEEDFNAGLYKYSFDSESRVTSCAISQDDEAAIIYISYNAAGKIEKISVKDEEFPVEVVLTYSYDAEGNLIPVEGTDVELEFDDYGNIISIQEEDGSRIEYEYKKINISSESIWNGCNIAAIRQLEHIQYFEFIPGWNHISYIFELS